MARDIRYRDGTVRHIYGGPETQRRRRRPSGGAWFIAASLLVLWIARAGGKT